MMQTVFPPFNSCRVERGRKFLWRSSDCQKHGGNSLDKTHYQLWHDLWKPQIHIVWTWQKPLSDICCFILNWTCWGHVWITPWCFSIRCPPHAITLLWLLKVNIFKNSNQAKEFCWLRLWQLCEPWWFWLPVPDCAMPSLRSAVTISPGLACMELNCVWELSGRQICFKY